MQFVLYWLTRSETLVTVVGPAVAFSLGLVLVPAWRQSTRGLVLIALATVPVSHVASFWSSDGLHIVPLYLLPYGYLVVRARLDLRQQWFSCAAGVWLATLVTDLLGAWAAWRGPAYTAPHWTWGIGGYGLQDGLVAYPLLFTGLLLLMQLVLMRGSRSSLPA